MKVLPNHIPVKLEDHERECFSRAMSALFDIKNVMKNNGCDTLICTDIESGEVRVSINDIIAAIDTIKHTSNLYFMTYGNGDCIPDSNDNVLLKNRNPKQTKIR